MGKRRRFLVAVMVVLLAGAATAEAATLRISWDANTESDLEGYKVFYRATGDFNWITVDVENVVTTDIAGVEENVEYCAYVVAYDASGNESAPSDASCAVLDTIPPAKVKGVKAVILKLVSWLRAVFG